MGLGVQGHNRVRSLGRDTGSRDLWPRVQGLRRSPGQQARSYRVSQLLTDSAPPAQVPTAGHSPRRYVRRKLPSLTHPRRGCQPGPAVLTVNAAFHGVTLGGDQQGALQRQGGGHSSGPLEHYVGHPEALWGTASVGVPPCLAWGPQLPHPTTELDKGGGCSKDQG